MRFLVLCFVGEALGVDLFDTRGRVTQPAHPIYRYVVPRPPSLVPPTLLEPPTSPTSRCPERPPRLFLVHSREPTHHGHGRPHFLRCHFPPRSPLLSTLSTLLILDLPAVRGLGPILSAVPSFTQLATLIHDSEDLVIFDEFLAAFDPPLEALVLSASGRAGSAADVLRALAEGVGKKAWAGLAKVVLFYTDGLDMGLRGVPGDAVRGKGRRGRLRAPYNG